MKSKLSVETQKHLDYIANRLIAKRAVVMVGSGFSRNSDPNMPTWSGLAEEFCRKLGVDKLEKPFDVLDLAEETQILLETKIQAKGKSEKTKRAIDSLIEKAAKISKVDLKYHVRLLNLPWADVLTTNYDTLLEQARLEVSDYRYGLVLCSADIPREYKPRIVKLHGSFKSDRKAVYPYIITKEDYRTYPDEFASFVNTVRQDMMESTMCLLGFSGEDPNFLSWLGWVRDILGENGPRVYLVGCFNLRRTRVSLLKSRNIYLVNYAPVVQGEGDPHKAAVSEFLDYLHDKVGKNKWKLADIESFCRDYNSLILTEEQKKVSYRKLINEWSKQRRTYPGWKVIPSSYRDELFWQIRRVSLVCNNLDFVDQTIEVDLLYEIVWILSSIGFPMCYAQNWNKRILKVIEQGQGVTDDKKAYLALAVMAGYRYSGESSKWLDVAKRMGSYTKHNEDIISAFAKESVLYRIQTGDKVAAESVIKKWLPKSTWWRLQKFMLEVALNHDVDIGSELNGFLKKIRDSGLDEYGGERLDVASQEAVVLCLLNFFRRVALSDSILLNTPQNIEMKDRALELKSMMCMVEDELLPLSRNVGTEDKKQLNDEHSPFGVEKTEASRHFYIKSFDRPNFVSLLYLMEQIGLPVQNNGRLLEPLINSEMIVKHVFDAPLGMATYLLCSCGVAPNAHEHFDRGMIIGMGGVSADAIVKRMIDALEEVLQRWNTEYERVPSFVIPVGRLCCKIQDPNLKIRFIRILSEIYKWDRAVKEANCIDEALELLIDSLQVTEIRVIVPELFRIRSPRCDALSRYAYKHPCDIFTSRWWHFLDTEHEKYEYDIDWSNVRTELNSRNQNKVFWAAKTAVLAERLKILPRDLHLRLLDFSKTVINESPQKFITKMDYSYLFEQLRKNHESVDRTAILSGVIESCDADIFDTCFVPVLLYCHFENAEASMSAQKGQSLLVSLSGRLKTACEKLVKTKSLCGNSCDEFFRMSIKGEIYAAYFKLLYLVDFAYRFKIDVDTFGKEIGEIRSILVSCSISTLGLDWFGSKERKMSDSLWRRLCSDFTGADSNKSVIAYNCGVDIIERSWNDAKLLLDTILISATADKTKFVVNILLVVERCWGDRLKLLQDAVSVYLTRLRDAYEDDGRPVEERLRIARDAIRVRTIIVRVCATDKLSDAIYNFWTSEGIVKELPFAEIRNAAFF